MREHYKLQNENCDGAKCWSCVFSKWCDKKFNRLRA